jgi:hypothetical protein
MWKIFRRSRYAAIDRRKQREEKRHRLEKAMARKKRRRVERWRRFRSRFKRIFTHPFSPSKWKSERKAQTPWIDREQQLAELRKKKAWEKAQRRKERARAFQNFIDRIIRFINDPLGLKVLTPMDRERLRARKYKRYSRKVAWQKWWTKFKKNPWRVILPRKKRRAEDGSYLYIYRMSKQERKALRIKKRKELKENFIKIITNPDLRLKFGFSFLHSTAYFIFAFMLIWVVYQLVTIMVASSFHIPVIWYYYQLKFPLYTYSPLYTRAALITIFAAGPIMSLMLAFVFLRLYFTKNRILKRFQQFYLWGFISGCNFFFGAYISGIVTHTEFVYASEWFFMSNGFAVQEIILSAVSFVMMLIIGRIVTPLFLLASGSVTLVKPAYRFFYILSQAILPWMAGVVILFLITLPNYYKPLILKTMFPVLMLVPSLFLYDSLQYENIHTTGVIHHNYFRWSIVIASVALLFFYRIILSWGLRLF